MRRAFRRGAGAAAGGEGRLMKEKLAKLIDVTSIITLAVIGVFCGLAATGKIDTQSFMTIATAIITFYFAKQQKTE